jgi:large subunit ribosomal protein L9
VASNVKVLLQADVSNLGSGGEVVKVRAGYARNFLLPRGLAVPATTGNMKRVDELKKAAAARAQQERTDAEDLGKKLGATGGVRIERAVGEEGKMYGSVTAKDIEEAFARAGVEVDRKRIQLADPIKQLGSFDVPVKLHADVTATLKVEVVKKGG